MRAEIRCRWALTIAWAGLAGCPGPSAPEPQPSVSLPASGRRLRPLPRGVPTRAGFFRELLPLDRDRAVAVFQLQREARKEPLEAFLTLVDRDGRPRWVRALPKDTSPGSPTPSRELVVVGDVVTVLLRRRGDPDPDRREYLGIYAFSVEDGQPRWRDERAYARDENWTDWEPEAVVADRSQRFEFAREGGRRWHAGFSGLRRRRKRRVTVYGPEGRQWSSEVGRHDWRRPPAVLTDSRVVIRGQNGLQWRVLDRKTGREVMAFDGEEETCHRGSDLYVVGSRLVHVDLEHLSKRTLVQPRIELPGFENRWSFGACGMLGHNPVLHLDDGPVNVLAVVDPTTGAIVSTTPLGMWDPELGLFAMPARLEQVTVLGAFHQQLGSAVVVVDFDAGSILWHSSRSERVAGAEFPDLRDYRADYTFLRGDGHTLLAADSAPILGVFDPRTGRPAQAFTRPARWVPSAAYIHGSELWLPPHQGFKLGHEAPNIVDLGDPPDDLMARVAMLEALRIGIDGKRRQPECPDPIRYLGQSGGDVDVGELGNGGLPDWDLAELANAAREHACAPAVANVLLMAWSVSGGDTARFAEALLLVEHDRYTLVHVYGAPEGHSWRLPSGGDLDVEPVTRYWERPANRDVYRILHKNRSSFVGRGSWTVISGNVIDENWKAATHQAPTWHFPPAIEDTP